MQRGEREDRLTALASNASAAQAVAAAVERTIGPKGLDAMLVAPDGEVLITNDGVTILSEMSASHPAARMIIAAARAQEEQVGDGTTTATLLAAALIGEAAAAARKGVPVIKLVEGIRFAAREALRLLRERARPAGLGERETLARVARVAARGDSELAALAVEAAAVVGESRCRDPAFRLADGVRALEGGTSEVFAGVVVDRPRLNPLMPCEVRDARVLVIDDALEPMRLSDEALQTEYGAHRQEQFDREFEEQIQRIAALDVGLVMVDRSVADVAEEALTDAGVMVVHRVASRELRAAAEHTGARPLKRAALRKEPAELRATLGRCARAYEDERAGHLRLEGGRGRPAAALLVGAATAQVAAERERIARDAAAAVQAAVVEGAVPGGGAIELWLSRQLADRREAAGPLQGYGVDCLVEALRRPLQQIATNAGFGGLEKVAEAAAEQAATGRDDLAVDCDTGRIASMWELGVVDPVAVKAVALRTATEVATAVLRIDAIIKKRTSGDESDE